jgi:hypothetical protein
MTTNAHRAATLASISSDIRRCEDLVRRMHRANDWRADALERAGELALSGRWSESREAALKAREA